MGRKVAWLPPLLLLLLFLPGLMAEMNSKKNGSTSSRTCVGQTAWRAL